MTPEQIDAFDYFEAAVRHETACTADATDLKLAYGKAETARRRSQEGRAAAYAALLKTVGAQA